MVIFTVLDKYTSCYCIVVCFFFLLIDFVCFPSFLCQFYFLNTSWGFLLLSIAIVFRLSYSHQKLLPSPSTLVPSTQSHSAARMIYLKSRSGHLPFISSFKIHCPSHKTQYPYAIPQGRAWSGCNIAFFCSSYRLISFPALGLCSSLMMEYPSVPTFHLVDILFISV